METVQGLRQQGLRGPAWGGGGPGSLLWEGAQGLEPCSVEQTWRDDPEMSSCSSLSSRGLLQPEAAFQWDRNSVIEGLPWEW